MFLCTINKNYPNLSTNTPSYLELWSSHLYMECKAIHTPQLMMQTSPLMMIQFMPVHFFLKTTILLSIWNGHECKTLCVHVSIYWAPIHANSVKTGIVSLLVNIRSGVRLIYLNRNQDSKSWFWFAVLFERIGNRISNRVDHTQFMILSESIIQRAEIACHPLKNRIIELKRSVCKVAGSCLWFWNHD